MADRIPVYIAHPLGAGPDREANRAAAAQWCALLAERYLVSPVADWIVLSGVWSENRRTVGLECDRAIVELVGTVIAVGPRVSPGMALEMGWPRRIVDLTTLICPMEPATPDGVLAALDEMDRRMLAAGFARADD